MEIEAAALYSFATDRNQPVVCFAYVTNEMGHGDNEFEKGDANGSKTALELVETAMDAWRASADGGGRGNADQV